jgi:hypothetical protein
VELWAKVDGVKARRRFRAHPFLVDDSASLRHRSKSLEVLIPILYLKGISTGDFEDALIARNAC